MNQAIPRTRRPARLTPARAFVLLVLVTCACHLACLGWGLPNKWDWAIDSVDGQTVVKTFNERFVRGWLPQYPPLHARLVTACWAPVRLLMFGRLEGATERDFEDLFGSAIVVARLVSIAMLAALLVAVRRLGRELWSDAAGVWAALLVGLSYPFVYYGHVANREVPYLCWYAWGLLYFVRAWRHGRLGDYLLMTLFLSLSLGTKDQAGGFLPLTGVALLARLVYQRRAGATTTALWRDTLRTLGDRRIWLSLGLFVLVFMANFGLPWLWQDFVRHLRSMFGPSFEAYRQFDADVPDRLAMLVHVTGLCARAMGWPAFVLGVVGLVWTLVRARRHASALVLWVPVVSYVAFFLLVVLVVWLRWVMPIVLVLGLLGGRVVSRLWQVSGHARAWARGVVILVAAFTAVYGSAPWWAAWFDARYSAEDWLEGNIPRGSVVLTFSGAVYLPRFYGDYDVRFFRPEIEHLKANDPDYVVLTSAYYAKFGVDTGGYLQGVEPTRKNPYGRFYNDLLGGRLGYRVEQTFRSRLPWPMRDYIPCLNPTVIVLRKAGELPSIERGNYSGPPAGQVGCHAQPASGGLGVRAAGARRHAQASLERGTHHDPVQRFLRAARKPGHTRSIAGRRELLDTQTADAMIARR